MAETETHPQLLFELAKLHSDRGDFFVAIEKLLQASRGFLELRSYSQYLKAQNLLLRMYAETDQEKEITQAKEALQDMVLKEGLTLGSKTFYTLSLCASYKGQEMVALEYAQKALQAAVSENDQEDLCYAMNALALIYFGLGRFEDSRKQLDMLETALQLLKLPDVQIAATILSSMILTEQKNFDAAIGVLWKAYDSVKEQKNMFLHIYLLANMGKTYRKGGNVEMARLYLSLAQKAVDPKNQVRLAQVIEAELAEVGGEVLGIFDLVFDHDNHTVTEKNIGKIDFKNQFILMDLLQLLLKNPGQIYTKEDLVQKVWRQNYDPLVHDNKIYVTIKRLRKMIEPDVENPKYIFRAKEGYFLNRSVRVHIEKTEGFNQ